MCLTLAAALRRPRRAGGVTGVDVRCDNFSQRTLIKNPSTSSCAQSRALHVTMGASTPLASVRAASGRPKTVPCQPPRPRRAHGRASPLCAPVKVRCETRNAQERGRYIRLKIGQTHFQWRGDRWPCWIRFRLFPRASALSERCTVVDTVSKQYRTPPHSLIRARAQKCQLGIGLTLLHGP